MVYKENLLVKRIKWIKTYTYCLSHYDHSILVLGLAKEVKLKTSHRWKYTCTSTFVQAMFYSLHEVFQNKIYQIDFISFIFKFADVIKLSWRSLKSI